jgi:LPXTG-motif cell wall-anchored protein
MKLFKIGRVLVVAAAAAIGVTTALAQVQSSTEVQNGAATKEVKVVRGEIVYVSGNDVVVKLEDGEIRHFPNVPESTKVNVGGKMLGVHELQPGMKVERTITTTTTPRMITTTQTVTGKVWQVMPPNSVILTMENGKNQQFAIPKNQKFTVDGQTLDAFGLRKGMQISATKITEVPETVVAQERKLTGKMPPPPPPPPAPNQPILIVVTPHVTPPATPVEVAAAPAPAAEPAPTKLPKTGSNLPLVGLLGLVSLALAGGMRFVRTQFASKG